MNKTNSNLVASDWIQKPLDNVPKTPKHHIGRENHNFRDTFRISILCDHKENNTDEEKED